MINGEKYLSRVPNSYQEVEYLSSDGTQYCITGLIGSDLSDCEIELIMRNDTTNTSRYNFNGAYLVGTTAQLGTVATSSTECRASINFGFADAISVTNLVGSDFHTIYAASGLQKVNNVTVGTNDFGALNSQRFLLFARTNGNDRDISPCYGMSLKSFTIKRNGQYIRNMIPVRRITDSVLGLYDTANDVFYTNQGTGTFTAGADVSPWRSTPIPTRKYVNGVWVDISPKQYINGEWV